MDAKSRRLRLNNAPVAIAGAAAALAFAVTAFAPQVLNDGDTFLHIAAGTRMLADRAILFADPFSLTRAGAAWDAHEWLAEIAMALAYPAGGIGGVPRQFPPAAHAGAPWPPRAIGRRRP